MKRSSVLLLTLLVHSTSAVTPLSKVLDMLDGMVGTCKEAKNTEETEFAKFSQWCDNTRKGYQRSISEAAANIVQLDADITKATTDAEEHAAAAEEHVGKADTAEKELATATAVRTKENTDFQGTKSDFEGAINAIERAKSTLKAREADVPQALMQVRSVIRLSRVPVATPEIDALLSLGNSQTPQANAYEFQSSSVVDMLEKMRLKFQNEKLALEKAELNSKGNHEVLAQRFTDTIKESKSIASEKTAAKAQRLDDAANSKGELGFTSNAKAEDEKALADMNTECHAKSEEFEKNQVVRSDEVQALEKASQILRSEDVSGTADTYLTTSQRGAAVALVQVRSEPNGVVQARVAKLLQERAQSLGSAYLKLAANRAASDPFGKVKQMIGDLIVKLMEEANSEADKKAFCDTELATNKQTRNTKQADVEKLNAGVEKHTAESEQLATQLTELTDAVAELNGCVAEATSLRHDESKTNAKTVVDAKAAQAAVTKAAEVLKKFYASAAGGAFLQMAAKAAAKAKAPYKGMQADSGNILGFLEVVLSDFARLETETNSAEDQAVADYTKFKDESEQDLAVKAATISHKEGTKRQADSTAAKLSKELALTQEELDAALTYYDKLKQDCVQTGLSYEERKEKRAEELQSLKEALQILNQEDIA